VAGSADPGEPSLQFGFHHRPQRRVVRLPAKGRVAAGLEGVHLEYGALPGDHLGSEQLAALDLLHGRGAEVRPLQAGDTRSGMVAGCVEGQTEHVKIARADGGQAKLGARLFQRRFDGDRLDVVDRGVVPLAPQDEGAATDDEEEVAGGEERPERPGAGEALAIDLLAEQPEQAPAFVETGQHRRSAEDEEPRRGEQDADEIPGARDEDRPRLPIEESQEEQVECQRHEEGDEDQCRSLSRR
jgi:hypothetical protein